MGLGTHTEAKANAIVTALEAVGASAAASDVRSDSPPDAENRADSGTDALVPQLERLVTLRDSGALTDEEFTIAKQRLLDSIE